MCIVRMCIHSSCTSVVGKTAYVRPRRRGARLNLRLAWFPLRSLSAGSAPPLPSALPARQAPMLTAPKLRSPSLPLLHPRDPLALIVDLAERCPESLPAAAAWPTNIVWSAAEGVIISADIYLEKTLFDAFRPLNATVNAVRPVRPVPPSPVGSLTGCHRWCRCLRQ